MEAGKRTLNDIFNGNRVLEIPFFQRAYVWGEDQWERFLEDMENLSQTQKPYFLGSVILKQQQTSTAHNIGDIRTLIDGQQRLTTLNIFFKVLCLKKNENASFNRMFVLEKGELSLWHNHNDETSFKRILHLVELETIIETDSIINAYNFFKKRIDIDKVDRQTILNNIMFVGIDLSPDEDEQQIFDTINSLGVRLTTAELLKNYFFDRRQIDNYIKFWKDVFEKDEDTRKYWDREITTGRTSRTFIDLFFYSYLQIKIQEKELSVKTADKVEFSKVETLFESYKLFINDYNLDKDIILNEIKEYAQIFKDNFDYNIIENELTDEYGIERINAIIFGLETSTLIPYVLFILKNIKDEKEKREIFEFIESYVVRRIVVKATTKNYNQLFTGTLISNRILSKNELCDFLKKRADKINSFPSDQELKDGFDNSQLINKQSAGILYLLESKIRDRRKQATQLLGISKYSLEHLMPKKWENNWGEVNNSDQVEFRNRKLLTLGNLTIITQSLNSSIRDSDWKIKKEGKAKNYGLVHFSAGIETLAPYLELQEWNEKEIDNRANFLYKKAVEIWKIDIF